MQRTAFRRRLTALAAVAIVVVQLLAGGRISAQSPGDGAGREQAQTAGPGALLDPRTLPPAAYAAPTPAPPLGPRLSDLDQATLRRLKAMPYAPEEPSKAQAVRDAAVDGARTPAPPLAPDLLSSFQGPTQNHNATLNRTLNRPPDPDIAVGPNHIVVVVNVVFIVYTKAGASVQERALSSWFSNVCSGCSVFDPRIAYDPQENRWILIVLHKTATVSRILLSVSQTSDPTGTWWNWSLDGSLMYSGQNTWADYPDVGFDGILSTASPSGAIYITVNNFRFSDDVFRTAVVYILSKAALYAGAGQTYWRAWNRLNSDGSQAFTLRAAKTYGNPGMEFLINNRNNGNYVTIWHINPTYPPEAVDWALHATVGIGSYSIPPEARQPGCANTLDTLDNRLINAVWRNNRIYTAFTRAADWGTPATVEALVHYLKINTSTNAAEVNVGFGLDEAYYFIPAITVDSNENIHLTFSRSSTSLYGQMRRTGRRIGAASTDSSLLVQAGVQCSTGFRWGDYAGAAVDPSDSSIAWIFGEYAFDVAGVTPDWDWGTYVGQLQFAAIFSDVPRTDWGFRWIEHIYNRGITAGCATGPLRYCPDNNVSRREMAVFLIRGRGESPPTGCGGVFADVPASDWGCPWVERLYALGVTAGCATSPLRYCPDNNVTRREMAVFLNRAAGQSACSLVECPVPTFVDVLATDWGYGWIERLYRRGITAGCATSPLRYCPDNNVTRREMAVFLIRNFFP